MTGPLRVGVSACLLGQPVRYDGGHKRDAFVAGALGRLVELVPVCPELEFGLGVPREPIRLERRARGVRLVSVDTRRDLTAAMRRFAARRAAALVALDLCGFVLKKDSPSCGARGVKVHSSEGTVDRSGRGLFAEALREADPRLPVVEEDRLADAKGRERFLRRVRAYRRWKDRRAAARL